MFQITVGPNTNAMHLSRHNLSRDRRYPQARKVCPAGHEPEEPGGTFTQRRVFALTKVLKCLVKHCVVEIGLES